jgi:hypothetical protein
MHVIVSLADMMLSFHGWVANILATGRESRRWRRYYLVVVAGT